MPAHHDFRVPLAVGVRLAYGEAALDGSNPTPVETGLTRVLSFTLASKTPLAPTGVLTWSHGMGGTVNVHGWDLSGGAFVASAGTDVFSWIAIGE